MIERVESRTETRQCDGVHRKLLQVGRDVHWPYAGAGVPARDQLIVDVEHRVVVRAQPGVAEAGQEHVVGLLPGGFAVEGGEESVTGQGRTSRATR